MYFFLFPFLFGPFRDPFIASSLAFSLFAWFRDCCGLHCFRSFVGLCGVGDWDIDSTRLCAPLAYAFYPSQVLSFLISQLIIFLSFLGFLIIYLSFLHILFLHFSFLVTLSFFPFFLYLLSLSFLSSAFSLALLALISRFTLSLSLWHCFVQFSEFLTAR